MKTIPWDSKTWPIGPIPPLFPLHLRDWGEEWEKGLWVMFFESHDIKGVPKKMSRFSRLAIKWSIFNIFQNG